MCRMWWGKKSKRRTVLRNDLVMVAAFPSLITYMSCRVAAKNKLGNSLLAFKRD